MRSNWVTLNLKCCRHISEVSDAASNDQNFTYTEINNTSESVHTGMEDIWCGRTIGVFLAGHERQDGFGIVVGLLFTGSAWILAVVGQFIDSAQITDCVTIKE